MTQMNLSTKKKQTNRLIDVEKRPVVAMGGQGRGSESDGLEV